MSAKAPMFKNYIINYAYANATGAMRNGSRFIKATDVAEAKKKIQADLSQDHDYFRITKIKEAENDNVQRTI